MTPIFRDDKRGLRNEQRIKVERDGRLPTLALNRPEVLNAVDELRHGKLAQMFQDVNLEKRLPVFTGKVRKMR